MLNILEACIDSPVNLQDSIQRYQDSIQRYQDYLQYARSQLNFVVGEDLYLISSDMNLVITTTFLTATSDSSLESNRDMNAEAPDAQPTNDQSSTDENNLPITANDQPYIDQPYIDQSSTGASNLPLVDDVHNDEKTF